MPQFRAEIPEIHTRITRPVVKNILDDVLKQFKDIPFREYRFAGDAENLLTPGSAIDTDKKNRSTMDAYVDVEVEDVADDEFGRSYQSTNGVNHFMFRCTRTKLDLFPVYQNRKLTIGFKVVAPSRVRINGLITRIQQAMQQSQTLFTHMVSYNYDIPVPCVRLLEMFHTMMQANYPYDDLDFDKWFEESKVEALQYATRLDGQYRGMIYAENAVNVLSNLVEHEEAPKKDKDDENGVWNINFDLEVRYQCPNAVRASYPPIVHNRFLPEIWFNKPKTYDYTNNAATSSLGQMAIERFKWNFGYGVSGRGDTGCKEPYFDDWGRKFDNKRVIKLFTALVTVDEADLRYFFDPINDINDYKFPDEINRLIKLYPMALLHEGKHFFDVRAYSWNEVIRPEHLSFTPEFKLQTDFDLNPRGYYHIVYSLNTDPTTIPSQVWDEALCEPEGLITYFSLFNDKYGAKLQALYDEMKEDDPDGEICFTRGAINEVIKDMVEDGHDLDNGKLYWDDYPWRTHLNYHVIGERGF